MDEFNSYLFGLLITDGHLSLSSRNRGCVSLEVSVKDEDIIKKLVDKIPGSKIHYRERNTNFLNNYKTCIFSNHHLEFRQYLIDNGYPIKDKTLNACPPKNEYNKYSFWRGVIDGDGSLGNINDKYSVPFVSLVTKSEPLKEAYCSFLYDEFKIKKQVNRNKRDNVYNIVIKNEEAIELAKLLYLNDKPDIYIDRKYKLAIKMQEWRRDPACKKLPAKRFWTKEEEEFILNHSLEESIESLNRTKKAILTKRYKLLSKNL